MQNQYDPSSSYYHQSQQPYQQPYQQNYGPPPGYAQHGPSSQPYHQPPGPGGYGYANPGASSQYYQQPPAPGPQSTQQPSLPPPSPQPGQARAAPITFGGHGPFAHLCTPGTNKITLTILDRGDKKDFLLAPGASKAQPLYTVHVTKEGGTFRSAKMKIKYHDGRSKKPKSVCKFKLHDHYAELSFSWLKWDLWPFTEDQQQWESDVETRDGHTLEWKFLGTYKDNGWVMRCYDVDDAYTGICSIVMTDYYSGKIEIDALSMKNQDCLDEMVCVAMAALNVYRGQQSAPDRGGTFPSSSSSSDSD